MKNQEILDFIAEVISVSSETDIKSIVITDSSETIKEWDSIVTVALATAISSKFNIEIGIEKLDKITKVENIINLINNNA